MMRLILILCLLPVLRGRGVICAPHSGSSAPRTPGSPAHRVPGSSVHRTPSCALPPKCIAVFSSWCFGAGVFVLLLLSLSASLSFWDLARSAWPGTAAVYWNVSLCVCVWISTKWPTRVLLLLLLLLLLLS